MPSVVVSHMFGTIGILVLFFVIIGLSTTIYSETELESTKIMLQDISEYVASEAEGIAALAERTNSDSSTIYKTLNFPTNVNNKGYIIEFQKDNLGFKVVSHIEEYSTIKGEALLNIKNGLVIFETNTLIHSGQTRPALQAQTNGSMITVTLMGAAP